MRHAMSFPLSSSFLRALITLISLNSISFLELAITFVVVVNLRRKFSYDLLINVNEVMEHFFLYLITLDVRNLFLSLIETSYFARRTFMIDAHDHKNIFCMMVMR